jgi:arylsulfatase A-like enzyme
MIKRSIAVFGALTAIALTSAHAAGARPNIVFILADDLGWADTTLYGHTKYHRTPNLERLAKRGITFQRAYSASPLCSPTRSSLLTGLHPARTGLTTPNCHEPQVVLKATPGLKAPPGNKAADPSPVTRLNTTFTTLAELLKTAGYATGHFGKWHLGPEPFSPLQQGFDVDVPHYAGPGPAGSYVAPWKFKDFDADPAVPDQHIEDRMAGEAVAFLEKNKDQPFFLNYWMFSVHAPFDAKKALVAKYALTANPADPQHCPTYAAMVESMDDAVGTLLDTLDRLQLTDKTIIVFTSDNGGNMYSDVGGVVPTSNAPLRGGKATTFEGGIRVPCVVSVPGTTAPGTRSEAMLQSTDFFPTLLELLAIPRPGDTPCDGKSIVPALRGQPFDRGAIFTYFPHNPPVPDWQPPSVAVHEGDWKLIRLFFQGENGAHRYKLFNLREDIGEKHDLAASLTDRVHSMDALIEKFLTETNAVQPIRNPAFDPTKYDPASEGLAKPKTKAPAKPNSNDNAVPALQGWKARDCTASVKDGILHLTNIGNAAFLGFSANQHRGPGTAKFRIKAAAGASHFDWLPNGPGSTARRAAFNLKGGGWEEIAVALPADGPLGIVRLCLPPQPTPVEIDWIELTSETGPPPTRTAF